MKWEMLNAQDHLTEVPEVVVIRSQEHWKWSQQYPMSLMLLLVVIIGWIISKDICCEYFQTGYLLYSEAFTLYNAHIGIKLPKKMNQKVDEGWSEKDAVEPIQHSPMPGKKFSWILYAQVSFDHRFYQVTNGPCYRHDWGKNHHETGAIPGKNPLHYQGDHNR